MWRGQGHRVFARGCPSREFSEHWYCRVVGKCRQFALQKIRVPENFFLAAFEKAREVANTTRSADVDLPQLLDFLKINTVWVTHMELTETFCHFRAETSRLQRQLVDLGFQQPIFYDIVKQCKFLPVPSSSSRKYCEGLTSPNFGNISRIKFSCWSPWVFLLSRDPNKQ